MSKNDEQPQNNSSSRKDDGGGKRDEGEGGGREDEEFTLPPKSEWTLISQGAEARVWKIEKKMIKDKKMKIIIGDDHNNSNDNDTQQQPSPPQQFIICKERFSKTYRHPDLDARLTKSRCRSEAKILEKCLLNGKKQKQNKIKNKNINDIVQPMKKKSKLTTSDDDGDDDNLSLLRVPRVLRVSPPSLFLEYIDGPSVKEYLQRNTTMATTTTTSSNENAENTENTENADIVNSDKGLDELAQRIGRMVGQIHSFGIIHGDLTTSNMMMIFHDKDDDDGTNNDSSSLPSSPSYELCPIDFGLSKSTSSVEEQAVDLYVLERALESTHPNLPTTFFDQVLKAYEEQTTVTHVEGVSGDVSNVATKKTKSTQTTLHRLEQVRMRGRKRECFG